MPGFTLALLLYLALDFGNPLMPGAVSFDADESVDAMRGGEVRGHQEATVPPVAQPARVDVADGARQPSVRRLPEGHRLTPLFSTPRRTYARQAESVPSSDDH